MAGQEILRKALQDATRLVDRDFFRRIEPAGHRHLDAFAALPMDDQRERGERRALARWWRNIIMGGRTQTTRRGRSNNDGTTHRCRQY